MWPLLIGPGGTEAAGSGLWKKWLTSSPIFDRTVPPSPPPAAKLHCLSPIQKNKKRRLDLGDGDGREGSDEIDGRKEEKEEEEGEGGRVGGPGIGYDDCDRGFLM